MWVWFSDGTYEMVDHGDEEVEEQCGASVFHLHLHRSASLECVARADDESEVVCSQLGVGGWCVGVGEASRR